MMKRIRKAWKDIDGKESKLTRSDLERYVVQCKRYLTTTRPGGFGLCWYADQELGDVGYKSAYVFWAALSEVKGSVAANWQYELDQCMHRGGRHTARIAMVKRLIVELEDVIAKDKRKR